MKMTLNQQVTHEKYLDEISGIVRAVKLPYQKFIVDINDWGYIDNIHTFSLLVYHDNLAQFSDPQRQTCLEWVKYRLEALGNRLPNDVKVGFEIRPNTTELHNE